MKYIKLGCVWGVVAVLSGGCTEAPKKSSPAVTQADSGGNAGSQDSKQDAGKRPVDTASVEPSADDTDALDTDAAMPSVGESDLEDGGLGSEPEIVTVQATDGGAVALPTSDASAPDAGALPSSVSLSGRLRISERLFLDVDVANLDVLPGTNDGVNRQDAALDESQLITSPSTAIGYLGPAVPLDDGGTRVDDVDYYKVQLQQGQIVSLVISEHAENDLQQADLDLFLWDETGELPIDESQGVGDEEVIVAPSTGRYWVAVLRYQDTAGGVVDDADRVDSSAVYTLTVGVRQSINMSSTALQNRMSTTLPIVPGMAIVEMEETERAGSNSASARSSVKASGQSRFQQVPIALVERRSRISRDSADTERAQRQQTIDGIKRLARQPGVKRAFPEYLYTYKTAPNDPLYDQQWHYSQLDLEQAWETTDKIDGASRGQGVIVAVIDTGIVAEHPDFTNADGSSQLVAGKDMVSFFGQEQGLSTLPDLAVDGDGYDDDPHDPGDGRTPGDHSFHGTHCAGTVAAATNNGEGGAGVAPLARVMPIRAMGRGGGISLDIAESIRWAAGLPNASGTLPEQPADIISMSLGGPRSAVFADAVAEARAAGVIVIAAAGNERSPVEFVGPAAEDGVVAVSATEFNRELAFYSNSGEPIDVAAPGGDTQADANLDGLGDGVISAVFKNGGETKYIAYQGTSMAAPHVAGVAALMKAVWPAMTPADFDRVLREITIDLGEVGKDTKFGHGLINANRAVLVAAREAQVDVTSEPVLSVSTTVLDFGGGATDVLPLTIENTGDDSSALVIDSIQVSAEWLSISAGEVGENTVHIDREHAELQEGVNVGSILIESNGGSVTLDVRLYLGEEPNGGDVDIVYVLLIDPNTGESVEQVGAWSAAEDGDDGDYVFNFESVGSGKYYLVAGTDVADSTYIGNDGNAYGAFPLAQDPLLFCILKPDDLSGCSEVVTESRTELEFNLQVLIDRGAEYVAPDDAEIDAGVTIESVNQPVVPKRVRRLW